MDELMGFVLGNSQRERVIQVLGSKGPMSAEKIAKIERITPPAVRKVLQDLDERGLIEESDGIWRLTEKGAELERELRRRP
ncbi:MAG: transcriptional regulator [Methanothrix sp.]|uniref:transcriptional regulator n=1 Tax=Methanothrix sp. TaxID=90426 RepID=UPI0032AF0150|nr:transcriptional regulator [Methanothrix sp.]